MVVHCLVRTSEARKGSGGDGLADMHVDEDAKRKHKLRSRNSCVSKMLNEEAGPGKAVEVATTSS
jgi:hypothetical protein